MSGADPDADEGRPRVTVEDRSAATGRDGPSCGELAGLLAEVLHAEGVPAGAEAALHLVGTAEVRALNSEHMGLEEPTDVLSFPIDGADASGAGGVPVLVGDVVLCPDVAAANAPVHAGTFADECRLLVVHGGLHLCGWDHGTPSQRSRMWARERELMAALGVAPSGDPWRAP